MKLELEVDDRLPETELNEIRRISKNIEKAYFDDFKESGKLLAFLNEKYANTISSVEVDADSIEITFDRYEHGAARKCFTDLVNKGFFGDILAYREIGEDGEISVIELDVLVSEIMGE